MDIKKVKTEEIDSDGYINSPNKNSPVNESTIPCQEEFDKGLAYAMQVGEVLTPSNDTEILDSNPVNQGNNQAKSKDELEFNF